MSHRLRRLVLPMALATGFAVASLAPNAAADGTDTTITKAQAKSLFQDALSLVAAGDYPGALDKLQQVASYKRTPAVVYYLGLCHEKTGQWVMALGEYRISLSDAQAQGRQDVAHEARTAVQRLAPQIPHIKLSMATAGGEGLAKVTMDGNPITISSGGRNMPVDPGLRVIEATAPGFKKFRKQIEVKAGDKLSVSIELEKAADAPPPGAASHDVSSTSATKKTDGETASESSSGGGSTAGWIVGGIGLASLAVSGVFYGMRSSAMDDLDSQCGADKNACPASAKSTYDDGKRDTLIGNVALGVGLAGVVTGIVLIATAPSASTEQDKGTIEVSKNLRVVPSSAGAWAGLSLDGSF